MHVQVFVKLNTAMTANSSLNQLEYFGWGERGNSFADQPFFFGRRFRWITLGKPELIHAM